MPQIAAAAIGLVFVAMLASGLVLGLAGFKGNDARRSFGLIVGLLAVGLALVCVMGVIGGIAIAFYDGGGGIRGGYGNQGPATGQSRGAGPSGSDQANRGRDGRQKPGMQQPGSQQPGMQGGGAQNRNQNADSSTGTGTGSDSSTATTLYQQKQPAPTTQPSGATDPSTDSEPGGAVLDDDLAEIEDAIDEIGMAPDDGGNSNAPVAAPGYPSGSGAVQQPAPGRNRSGRGLLAAVTIIESLVIGGFSVLLWLWSLDLTGRRPWGRRRIQPAAPGPPGEFGPPPSSGAPSGPAEAPRADATDEF